MATAGRPAGGAGRAPRDKRTQASRQRRSTAALPSRTPAVAADGHQANLTARAAILAVAIASVVLAVALPFKVWIGQRGQIHALQAQTRQQEQRVVALHRQEQRWNDPSYVMRQARSRLHYALPGEKTYVVLGDAKGKHHAHATTPATPPLTGPWYSRLWQSVEASGGSSSSTS